MKVNSGDLVIPGDFLAVSEQFLPGEGVFEDDGLIKSSTPGNVFINYEDREISVISDYEGPVLLKHGDIVYGQVEDIKAQKVLIDVQSKKDCSRALALPYKAAIHISQVKKGYLDKMNYAFRIGDIIVGKVIKITGNNIDLTTNDYDLGVIKAMCTKCRSYLKRYNRNELLCPNCNRKERRKIASTYID